MSDYATMEEAEGSAKSLMDAGTVIEAHVCRTATGAPAVRILRPMSATDFAEGMNKSGAWVTVTAEADA